MTHSRTQINLFHNQLKNTVASERNQHCGGQARLKGLKLETWRAGPWPQVLGEGALAVGGLRERCELSQWGPGRSPYRREFGCILGSSDELSCSPVAKLCMYAPI